MQEGQKSPVFFVEAARDKEGSYPVRLTYNGTNGTGDSSLTSFELLQRLYAAVMVATPTTIYHTREGVRGIEIYELKWSAPEGVEGCGRSVLHLIGAGFAEPAVLSALGEQKKTSHDWASVCLLTEEAGKIKVIPDRDKSMTWPPTVIGEAVEEGYVGTEQDIGVFNFGANIAPELVKVGEFADEPLPEGAIIARKRIGGVCVRRFIDDFGPVQLRKFRNTNPMRTGLAYPIQPSGEDV